MSSVRYDYAKDDVSPATKMTEAIRDISGFLNKSITSFGKIETDLERPLAGPYLPVYRLTSAYSTYHYNRAICNLSQYQAEELRAEDYYLPLNELWLSGYFRNILLFRLLVADMMGAVTLDSLQDLAESVARKRLNDTQRAPTRVVELIWYYYAPDLTLKDRLPTGELTEDEKYHNAFLRAPRNALDRLVAPERGKLRTLDTEADFNAFKEVLFEFDPITMRSMWDQWRDHDKDWWEGSMDLELRVVTRPFRSLIDACRFYHQRTYYGFTYLLDLSSMFDAEIPKNNVTKRSSAKEKSLERPVSKTPTSEAAGPIEVLQFSPLDNQVGRDIELANDFDAPVPLEFEYDSPRKIDWNTPDVKQDVDRPMSPLGDVLMDDLKSLPPTPPESPKLSPINIPFIPAPWFKGTQLVLPDISPYRIELLKSSLDRSAPNEVVAERVNLSPPARQPHYSPSKWGRAEGIEPQEFESGLDVELLKGIPRIALRRPTPELGEAQEECGSPRKKKKLCNGESLGVPGMEGEDR